MQRLRAAPGSRTPLTCLEGRGTSRCASAAWWSPPRLNRVPGIFRAVSYRIDQETMVGMGWVEHPLPAPKAGALAGTRHPVVGMVRLELTAPRSRSACATKLRHMPLCWSLPGRAASAGRESPTVQAVIRRGQVRYALHRSPWLPDQPARYARYPARLTGPSWTAGGSNAVPPVCKTGALPGELAAHGG